jgi:pantoate--beta-alanine ligase
MIVAKTVEELRSTRDAGPGRIGLVPTMGYLHEGHLALVRRARTECERVVASIFVNPTQFGPGEDFATYPRDLDRDLALLGRERVDVVFAPDEAGGFYPTGADTFVEPGAVSAPLEGERRPGHFRGVATVVTMLFNAVQPHRAYFGEKDWQQLQVVRRMVRDLHLPVTIVPVPIVRESDGLAMSSRNVRLSPVERVAALCIPRALAAARAAFEAGETDPSVLERVMAQVIRAEPAARLDYAVVADAETLMPVERASGSSRALIATRVGAVRLIDNGALGAREAGGATRP